MSERKMKRYTSDLKEFKSDGDCAQRRNEWKVSGMREDLKEFDADNERDERVKKGICRTCHYIELKHLCSLDAITFEKCAVCSNEMVFGSTLTDKICVACASEHGVCRHCLQPMD